MWPKEKQRFFKTRWGFGHWQTSTRVSPLSSRGFTLLELMIAVAIVAALAAIAIPAFQRYIFEAKLAEGTKMLLEAWKDKETTRQVYGVSSEHLESNSPVVLSLGSGPVEIPALSYRTSSTPRFNLIFGSSGLYTHTTQSGGNVNAKYAFSDLAQFHNSLPEPANKFGTFRSADGDNDYDPRKYLIGAEADLDGDGQLQVMAVNEQGMVFVLCDDWNDGKDSVAAQQYASYSLGGDIECTRNQSEGSVAGSPPQDFLGSD